MIALIKKTKTKKQFIPRSQKINSIIVSAWIEDKQDISEMELRSQDQVSAVAVLAICYSFFKTEIYWGKVIETRIADNRRFKKIRPVSCETNMLEMFEYLT
jgi:hypothetical protein